ncbi:MAG: ABC transporter ATP-binding protein [bacterium]|nr:MAG: ABC transporter ATP-binding protein [bacterium]
MSTESSNGIIVELKSIFFSYGSMPVLEDVSFTIHERDFLGIIGPNGGGKTTILQLILGLLVPDRGEITVFGSNPKTGRRRIGYVPQLFLSDLDFPISVLEVVLMGKLGRNKLLKRYSKRDRSIALDALRKVGMENHGDRQIGELSGGERQRVFIARALTTEPRILMLDEPLSSIDTRWQNSFYDLLKELNGEMAIVLVTHDVGALSAYVKQVACLNRKLYYHGSTTEGIEHLVDTYKCPIELIAHGLPHRVLGDHE